MSTTKIYFVGDVHGSVDIMQRMYEIAKHTQSKVVFVGDYVDAWERTNKEQLQCLELIHEMHKDPTADVVFLLGNHELNYINSFFRCSGYSKTKEDMFKSLIASLLRIKVLKPYFIVDNILVTHAGLSAKLCKDTLTLKGIEQVQEFLDMNLKQYPAEVFQPYMYHLQSNPMYQVGATSGGQHDTAGGIFWCRPIYPEWVIIPGIIQVFGHHLNKTAFMDKNPRLLQISNNAWNIDVDLQNNEIDKAFILEYDTDTKTLTPLNAYDITY